MKVFTFFYNRYDNATTSIALRKCGIDHTVLIHNEEQKEKFINSGTAAGDIVVTGEPKGLAYQRNAALRMMEEGEWAVFMCDDFIKIKSMPREMILGDAGRLNITNENQSEYRLKREIDLKEMFSYFPKFIEMAEKHGINLIGFGLHDNPRNLAKKYTTRGLADGRFWVVRKTHLRFDENVQSIDDIYWTAENLVAFGNVLICNWIVPYFSRYSDGGYGGKTERTAMRKRECSYLERRFKPLVRVADKPNWERGTHVRIYGTQGNIEKARERIKSSKR